MQNVVAEFTFGCVSKGKPRIYENTRSKKAYGSLTDNCWRVNGEAFASVVNGRAGAQGNDSILTVSYGGKML